MDNIFFDKKDLMYCGENVIIGKSVRIRRPELVSIGDNVIIDDFTYISCGMSIGPFTHIAPNCTFIGGAGFVKIGAFAGVSAGSRIITASSDYRYGGLNLPTIPDDYLEQPVVETVEIRDFGLLGVNTVVLPGTIIPEGMSTGAFSLVKKQKYEKWTLYAGNPIHKIGFRESDKMIFDGKRLLEEYRIDYKICEDL